MTYDQVEFLNKEQEKRIVEAVRKMMIELLEQYLAEDSKRHSKKNAQ